jgi:hypothetical protein
LGRQELPKSISQLAWSERWNVFSNTYGAALLVNTSITDTTLVGAWVHDANQNGLGIYGGDLNWFAHPVLGNPRLGGSNLNDFNDVNGDDGIFMITAQNKSFAGLTLTGSWYYADSLVDNITNDLDPLNTRLETGNSANILWGDATYSAPDTYGLIAGIQGGTIMDDDFADDTTAFGAKIGGTFGMFSASVAYSTVNDGGIGVFNVGGVKTPLYTQMILNQNAIAFDNDTVLVKGVVKALGGKFIAQYGMTTMNDRPVGIDANGNAILGDLDYNELDVIYKTKVWNDQIALFAAYVNRDSEGVENLRDAANASYDNDNLIRFWARYNF